MRRGNAAAAKTTTTTRRRAAAADERTKLSDNGGDFSESDLKTCRSASSSGASAAARINNNKIHNAFQALLKDYQSSLLGLQAPQQQQQQNFSQTAFERSEQWHELMGDCGADIKV
ncbi:MAG: hypothetical protein MHMPM18_004532, partial [Marteilia pararefringens]